MVWKITFTTLGEPMNVTCTIFTHVRIGCYANASRQGVKSKNEPYMLSTSECSYKLERESLANIRNCMISREPTLSDF